MHGSHTEYTAKRSGAAPLAKRLSNAIAWLAGVEPRRLAEHSSTAQYAVKAIGITMTCLSGPVAAAAMGSYIWLNTPGFSAPVRVVMAVVGGLIWAFIALVAMDRTLLIASDAVGTDNWWRPVLGFLLRVALAALMASLFSDMLIEVRYAGIAQATASHLALGVAEQDAQRIAKLNGLPDAQALSKSLGEKEQEFRGKYDIVPPEVLAIQANASRCDRQARNVAAMLVNLEDGSPERLQAEEALRLRKAECRVLHADAVRKHEAYRQAIAKQIASAESVHRQADDRARTIATVTERQRTNLDADTQANYASVSGRTIGFEEAKASHPEIRRGARMWWWAFFAAELMPLLLKTLLFVNNPVSAQARADLADVAKRHRLRARRAALVERRMAALFDNPQVAAALDASLLPSAIATEHLAGFEAFADQLVASQRRAEDLAEAYPDLAAQIYEAYAAAMANALQAMRSQYAGAGGA